MDCCNNSELKVDDNLTYCVNCFSCVQNLVFDEWKQECPFPNSARRNKFENILNGTIDLPWFVRCDLSSIFPIIERKFFDTSYRKNFINLQHLAYEICIEMGYEKYCNLFQKLKTPTRAKVIKNFVRECLRSNNLEIQSEDIYCSLENLPMINPKCNSDFKDPRILDIDRIYH